MNLIFVGDSPLELIVPVMVFAGVALLIFLIVMAVRRYERLRTEALRDAGTELGLELREEDVDGQCAHIHQFKLGNSGHSKKLRNVISGVWSGEDVLFCDYRYVVGGGKHQHTYSQSVMFMALESSFPDLVMAPESVFSKIGQVFGAKDIDFLTHPEFSKSFLLKGEDEDSIRESFDFDLLEYFEQRLGITLEVLDDELIFYRSNKRCKPDDLETFFAQAFELKAALGGKLPS